MARAMKRALIYFVGVVLFVLIIELSGFFRHAFERDYFSEFSYPLDLPNFASVVRRYGKKELTAYDPINHNYANITFLKTANSTCMDSFRLIILVKSAPQNVERRQAIRATWGYSKRFSDVAIKTVFLIGVTKSEANVNPRTRQEGIQTDLNAAVDKESTKYGDIVQANFIDSYYNNTYKTMMGMRWLVEECQNFRFAFFSDDDMYVSVKNLLKFLRHPTSYPEYWENQKRIDKMKAEKRQSEMMLANKLKQKVKRPEQLKYLQQDYEEKRKVKGWRNSPIDFDIDLDDDAQLYAGYVYFLPPYRHKLGSKWFLSLEEYPFNYLPPYVPAGSVALSKATVLDLYYASLFTKPFRFDDVFIAICAKKMGIEPYHSEYFRLSPSYPIMDRDDVTLEYLITWHGFDPDTLVKFWNAQKSVGNA